MSASFLTFICGDKVKFKISYIKGCDSKKLIQSYESATMFDIE